MALSDIYQKATLVQIPSGYKASDDKLYSVVPSNGDGDFTVTGDPEGEATRVNKNGLIESVSADQARLNYDFDNPQDPHLLLEPTRTNYVLHSNDASQWTEVTSNGTVTTIANYSTAPNGANEATRLQASVSGSGYATLLLAATTAFTGSYSSAVYLKSNTGSNQTVCFYGRNNTTNLHTVTNEWTRIEITGSTPSGFSAFSGLGINTGFGTQTNPIDILVWGGQLEEGTYSTSLIPTSDSIGTRTEDNVQIASGAGDIVGSQNEGTLFIDLEIPYDTDSIDYFQFCISDQVSTTNRVLMNFISGEVRFQVFSDDSEVGFCNTSTPKNTRLKIAGSYKTNEFVLYKNGSLADTIDTTGVVDFTTQMETLRFADFGNGKKFQAKVHQVMFFQEALTQSELQILTS